MYSKRKKYQDSYSLYVVCCDMWFHRSFIRYGMVYLYSFVCFGYFFRISDTAIEAVVDLCTHEIHPLAKTAKDTAAGAVLVSAMASVIIGLMIFIPKLFN